MLPLRHALALGLLQGPTELLPVSSSAHTALLPWLAGWSYPELDPRTRKSFEVALHAGAGVALLARSGALLDCSGGTRSPKISFVVPAVVPAALTGYTLGEPIERRLGTPATIAAGMLAGAGALLAGDLNAVRREARDTSETSGETGGRRRARRDHLPTLRDGLTLGTAQALALIPGVSRSGAALTAARIRGFSRREADELSWTAGLPVIAGAAVLQSTRLLRAGVPRELRLPLVTGAGAAFLSTLLSARLLTPSRRATLLPACSTYRAALAVVVIRRVRGNADRSHKS